MFDPYSDGLHMPERIFIEARFRTFDESTKMEMIDPFVLEVKGSDEDLTDFCNYESLRVRPGTQMSGVKTINIVSDEENDWQPREVYISTEIEGLEEFRMYNQNRASVMTMTIEARLPSLNWEQIWSSNGGSAIQWLWVDQRDLDVNWIMIQINRWNFVNEIQWKFGTLKSKFIIPMKVTWRDGKGQSIIEEGFSLELNDISNSDKPCKDATAIKKGDTRDFLFNIDAWKYMDSTTNEERQQRHIENTLDIDFSQSSFMQECYPKFQLLVKGAFNDEWTVWSERQRELRAEGFNGTIWFTEWGTSVELNLTPEDVDLLQALYSDGTSDVFFMEFMTTASIPGSEAMGPETPRSQLAHSTWKLWISGRQKTIDCADSKIWKSDLTVAGEWRDHQTSYQVLPAGTAPEPWTISTMKVVPTVKGCPFETAVNIMTREGW